MQIEFIGSNSIDEIRQIVDNQGANIIFIVTGNRSFYLSGAEKKLNNLLKNKKLVIFNNFSPNPKFKEVKAGVKALISTNPDLVIAVGGGSVIDMAKLINILAAQKTNNYREIIIKPGLINNKGVPLVAIPTTAGSGSQATHFAVVYIENKKHSLAHKYILPDYAIIDSSLSVGSSKSIAAVSVMDALSQSIESLWSVNSTSESQQYALKAIKLIVDFSNLAINEKNEKAFQFISVAAHLSGKAINITKTTVPHAISYILTSNFNIPHGHAVALLVAPVAYISHAKDDNRFERSLQLIFKLFNCSALGDFIEKWQNLMRSFGLAYKLKDLNVSFDNMEFIVENINTERLKNHSVHLTKKDLKQIVSVAFEGL